MSTHKRVWGKRNSSATCLNLEKFKVLCCAVEHLSAIHGDQYKGLKKGWWEQAENQLWTLHTSFFTSIWLVFGRTTSNTTRSQQGKGNRPEAMLRSQLRFIPLCLHFPAKLFPTRETLVSKKNPQVKMLNTGSSAQEYNTNSHFSFSLLFFLLHKVALRTYPWPKICLDKIHRAFKISLPSKSDSCTCSELLIGTKSFFTCVSEASR